MNKINATQTVLSLGAYTPDPAPLMEILHVVFTEAYRETRSDAHPTKDSHGKP